MDGQPDRLWAQFFPLHGGHLDHNGWHLVIDFDLELHGNLHRALPCLFDTPPIRVTPPVGLEPTIDRPTIKAIDLQPILHRRKIFRVEFI